MEQNNNFSLIQYTFENFIKSYQENKGKNNFSTPFKQAECTEEKQKQRIINSINNFWYFDISYFTPELYDNYAKPNVMMKDIVKASEIPGYHLFLGPRKHGKTVTAKKLLLWKLLTGIITVAGVYAETIIKSSNILKDIFNLVQYNTRILYDYDIVFKEANSDQLSFTVNPKINIDGWNKSMRYCASFSEGRSVRGYSRLFNRPQFLLGDDIETLESSFSTEAVRLRIEKLMEAYHSLEDGSTFIILGNDISVSSAVHQLRIQAEQNLLPTIFHLHLYKAWQNNKPLWYNKYPAESIEQLKSYIKPLSESDWQTNYMQNPVPPEGYFFQRDYYTEYITLPSDTKAVLYCDPNLSKKGKGDTTAITILGYSPKNDKYYILDAICKSFSDANMLLDTIFKLKSQYKNIYAIAFDGNVAQESTWSNFVRNWCIINQLPFPYIEYKRYNVNLLAKNIQLVYNEKKILFPKDFSKSIDGEQYLAQLFSFTGEKKSGKDDAPDSLICAFEFLHERKFVTTKNTFKIININDFYKL